MRINKQILRLYGAFTALEAFRLIYLRLCFWITDRTGLVDMENGIFILSCAAILAGMTAFPLLLDKTKLGVSPERVTLAVRAAVISAGAAAAASYFTQGSAALAFQFITMLCASGAMSAGLRMMSVTVPSGKVGQFFGLSQVAGSLLGAFLFFSPFAEVPTLVMLIAACVLIALAAIFFTARHAPPPETEDDCRSPRPSVLPGRILRPALAVMCLYAVVGGLLDNLYFFDDAFNTIPYYMFWILLYAGLMNVAGGCLLDRVSKPAVVIAAFALICAGQSMAFFTTNSFFGYLYILFANGGSCVMELFLLALPVVYCGLRTRNGKKPGALPGLGYILLYGSFFLSSILFEFIPESAYMSMLGVALIVTVTAILVTFRLSSEDKARQFERTEKDLNARLAAARTAVLPKTFIELIAAYGITEREAEVLRLLLAGRSTAVIAAELVVTENTVYKYISSMNAKTKAGSRTELIAIFMGTRS
ncbi:MAG: LuxR C-terminal-related transcriptional regulator [Oscillospiraceae bacterium]|jgi:DNA-binding CsgD family transcriptional regulator|nr:LuxR C-terminal-related transcriptional regulator [Oscillospiraceae bacterium]